MGAQRDDDGFFSTATERLTTETVALSSEAVKFGESGTDDWWADRDLATVRLSARSSDASTVFIGIAPSADVARRSVHLASQDQPQQNRDQHGKDQDFRETDAEHGHTL
jgi:hypothetical protein